MPFRRKGLCRTDQFRCAKMLTAGVKPEIVAKELRCGVKCVLAHTQEAMDKVTARAKGIEVAAVKHAADTRVTATALAGAAKEILSQVPEPVPAPAAPVAQPSLLKPAVAPVNPNVADPDFK